MNEQSLKNRRSRAAKLQRHLTRRVSGAVRDFAMVEEGDRVMVCISGGKDSFTLLDLLVAYQRQSKVKFDLFAVHLDHMMPGFPGDVLPEWFEGGAVPFSVVRQDIYATVKRVIPEGKNMCGLCSRLRRGALYRHAEETGMTKIALGHHREDMVETLFLNMFYGGRLKGMPPKLLTDSQKHVVIRPMAYVGEKDIVRYAALREFPIISGDFCGTPDNLQRQAVKAMLVEWRRKYPGRVETIFRSMQNVDPSQLADRELFDFDFSALRD